MVIEKITIIIIQNQECTRHRNNKNRRKKRCVQFIDIPSVTAHGGVPGWSHISWSSMVVIVLSKTSDRSFQKVRWGQQFREPWDTEQHQESGSKSRWWWWWRVESVVTGSKNRRKVISNPIARGCGIRATWRQNMKGSLSHKSARFHSVAGQKKPYNTHNGN